MTSEEAAEASEYITTGRISLEAIKTALDGDFSDPTVLVCGRPAFNATVSRMLAEIGVPATCVHVFN